MEGSREKCNVMNYERWMERKLYDPHSGYYMKEKDKIGKRGDFYTAESFSIFAECIANYFIQCVKKDQLEPIFCEIGSGTGRFIRHFLKAIQGETSDSLRDFRYISVEKSPYHRKSQLPLTKNENVQLLEEIDQLEPMEGMLFMNEFFDALPVHVIEKKEGRLYEVWVTTEAGKFSEIRMPLRNERIVAYLKQFPNFRIQDGQRVEIPIRMEELYRNLAKRLKRGYMVIVDYGYTFVEWRRPSLKTGSLRGYKNHRMVEIQSAWRENIDMTTHIHFDALLKWGKDYGLKTVEFLTQRAFLIKEGILHAFVEHDDPSPFSKRWKKNAAIRSLIAEDGMGEQFHVIVQKK